MEKYTIKVKVGRELIFLEVHSIICIKAENIYTFICTTQRTFLATQTFGEMEEKLNQSIFFKPNRSYLINLKFIRKYLKSDGTLYLFDYDFPVPVSRNRKHLLQKLIH